MGFASDLRSALDRVTRPPLATAVGALMLVLLGSVVAGHLAGLEEPTAERAERLGTGDFLAFWTGAVFIHDGRGGELYDYRAQVNEQARILGGPSPIFQPYLNPPLLALALAPLAGGDYVDGFLAYDAACVVLLAAGLAMMVRTMPALGASRGGAWTLVLLAASFPPVLQTTFGGQNTPITLALLAALALATRRDSAAGIALALGLLTYKPQYAIGTGLALLLGGRVAGVAGGAALGLVHAAIGAWACGARWPVAMLEFFGEYRPREVAENGAMHFSWIRVSNAVLPSPVDAVASALGVMLVLGLWWRYRAQSRGRGQGWFALVALGVLALSPHLQYYDAGLLVLPAALLVDSDLGHFGSLSLAKRLGLAATYVGYPLWEAAPRLGFQPLFLPLVALLAWSVAACARDSAAGKRPSTDHAVA